MLNMCSKLGEFEI